MNCKNSCHMACCKEILPDNIKCLGCNLANHQSSIGREDIEDHKRFLGAHFTGISILSKSSDMSYTIKNIDWDNLISRYLLKPTTFADFLSFLLDPSNEFYIIRRSNGKCLLLPKTDEILNAFNFSIFDFILITNREDETVRKFTALYELIEPLPHIIETETSSKCISKITHAQICDAIKQRLA